MSVKEGESKIIKKCKIAHTTCIYTKLVFKH